MLQYLFSYQFLNDSCRDTSNDTAIRHILGDNSPCGDNTVGANGHTRQYDGVGSYPDIIADDDLLCRDAQFVNPSARVLKIVVQGRNSDTLSQMHMTANGDRTNNSVMQADARIVTDDNVAHGIIDAAEGLHDAPSAY